MSPKRYPEEKGRFDGSSSDDKRRRVPAFRNAVLDVMRIRSVQSLLEPILEPLIRRVVKEEVELALSKHLNNMKRNHENDVYPSEIRSLQLKFLNNLSLPVFTGTRIEGEDCTNLKVALMDGLTGQTVLTEPESSARVEIVVLEGDFDSDECENWTLEEFKNNIVREREGKKPLLSGDAFINLKDGIGSVGEISFSDNSSWTRSRKFRLGARVVDNFDGTQIREAKTESFIVRDHRGELYKKHHPPSLFDEVWRLEKIGKDGAFHKRLGRESINTVKDFLTLLILDPSRLRNILGTGMSAKMWEVTVEHARTCVIDKRIYLYCPLGSQQKSGVAFNVVGQVMGLLADCQYVPVDKLPENEKAEAQKMVITAFEHWEEVISFEDELSLSGGSSLLNNALYTSSSPRVESLNSNKLMTSQKIGGFDYTQPIISSPDIMSSIYSIGGLSGIDDFPHAMETMALRYDQHLNFPEEVTSSMICDTDMAQAFLDSDHLGLFDALQSRNPCLELHGDELHGAVNNFLYPSSSSGAVFKAQRRWAKISSVLKWFSIRKMVARKKVHASELQRYG